MTQVGEMRVLFPGIYNCSLGKMERKTNWWRETFFRWIHGFTAVIDPIHLQHLPDKNSSCTSQRSEGSRQAGGTEEVEEKVHTFQFLIQFQCLLETGVIPILTHISFVPRSHNLQGKLTFYSEKRIIKKNVIFTTDVILGKLKCHSELGEVLEYLWCFNFLELVSVPWNERAPGVYHSIILSFTVKLSTDSSPWRMKRQSEGKAKYNT